MRTYAPATTAPCSPATVSLSARCSGCAASCGAKNERGTSKLHTLSSTPPISARKAVISNPRTALDSQQKSLHNGFLRFALHARGSVAQCGGRCATMRPPLWPRARAAANQRRATMPPGGIVAGVHMERAFRRDLCLSQSINCWP
jgi:hypothetical protein